MGAGRYSSLVKALPVVGLLAGCSAIFPASEHQCATDADCAEHGTAFTGSVCVAHVCQAASGGAGMSNGAAGAAIGGEGGASDGGTGGGSGGADNSDGGNWSCLGHVVAQTPTGKMVKVTVPIVDGIDQSPIAGVSLRACQKLDVECQNPIGDSATTDASGNAVLTVPSGFDGFAEATGADVEPSVLYFEPPIIVDTVHQSDQLFKKEDVAALYTVVTGQTQMDPNTGFLILYAPDCDLVAANGVTFTVDRSEGVFAYVIEGAPDLSATQTDSSGAAANVGLAPGPVSVSGTRALTGQHIGLSTGIIRSGWITYIDVVPSP